MAFDLVNYFAEQIAIQKPQLLNQYDKEKRKSYLFEVNALTLGKLVSLWRQNADTVYQEIKKPDPLYAQEIARHLTTSPKNQSDLDVKDLEQTTLEILELQFVELKQLDETGNFGKNGLRELLLGQIEHLSGQAYDWVWTTNELNELIGSKPIEEEEISLDEAMKEFNQMVHSQHAHDDHIQEPEVNITQNPTWAKFIEPIVALVVIFILFSALHHLWS